PVSCPVVLKLRVAVTCHALANVTPAPIWLTGTVIVITSLGCSVLILLTWNPVVSYVFSFAPAPLVAVTPEQSNVSITKGGIPTRFVTAELLTDRKSTRLNSSH